MQGLGCTHVEATEHQRGMVRPLGISKSRAAEALGGRGVAGPEEPRSRPKGGDRGPAPAPLPPAWEPRGPGRCRWKGEKGSV